MIRPDSSLICVVPSGVVPSSGVLEVPFFVTLAHSTFPLCYLIPLNPQFLLFCLTQPSPRQRTLAVQWLGVLQEIDSFIQESIKEDF